MRPAWALGWALALAESYLQAGGFVLHLETDCPLSADGQVLWANWTLSFNKIPFVCYDNDLQQFQPCGLGEFFPWNYTSVPISNWLDGQLPGQGQKAAAACLGQTHSLWGRTGERRTPPNVRIFPVTPRNTPAPIMLACVAWGFFPSEVDLSWWWNGALVKSGMGPPKLSSNGDWTYQARLTLPVDPEKGGVYTCRVAHVSLTEAVTKDWAPGLPLDLRVKVGAAGAVLGIGVVFFGVACSIFIKRMKEREAAGYVRLEGNSYPEGPRLLPARSPPTP
uniref:Class II histocompatibility antigen, M beta 1 chain isoform X1 n=1 Tax=Pogona vitticeps TaxID=103695 RepID=A0ABM5FF70_9SAUR